VFSSVRRSAEGLKVIRARRFINVYRAAALILLNTLVAFVVVNLLLGAGLGVKRLVTAVGATSATGLFTPDGAPVNTGRRSSYQLAWFDALAYPELGPAAIAEVLDDFYDLSQRGLPYESWVQFAEPSFEGRRVTVLADELLMPMRRTTNPMTAGRMVRIYVFGGSTTFGYSVADEHTWPSALSRILNTRSAVPVEVRNYGRGYYYPSQEVALFVDLLRSGHRPSLAIFMDGVNVGFGQDVPQLSFEVTQAVHAYQHARGDWDTVRSLQLRWLPLWQLVRWARRQNLQPEERIETRNDVATLTAMLARRFEANRRIAEQVGRLYGVRVLHVIQPNALVNYPVDLYRKTPTERFMRGRLLATALYARLRSQAGTLYLGDLLGKWGHRKALVDNIHYNPGFGEFLAMRVAEHVPLTELQATQSAIDPSAVTGEARAGRPYRPLPHLTRSRAD
jgi:hypothetical protein